jgi:transcriptional regulator with GAF, ATPase, and Fis domain
VRNGAVISFSAANAAASASLDPFADGRSVIGQSPVLQEALDRVHRVAPTDTTVLITGETGTGKELVAQAIHRQSRRAARPLVAAHLAAIPEGVVGSELFGHERGAFTGADRARIGRFELADRGTLFLDEVGELPAHVQVSLLRVLQEGELERIGSNQVHRVDVRVIAATNRNLDQAMEEGLFRPDLFYRLNVVPIHLPPLRERRDDIESLARHFLGRVAARLGRQFDAIEAAALDRLRAYHWPGNIRQLQNVIEQCAVLCDGPRLYVPQSALTTLRPATPPTQEVGLTLEDLKRRYVDQVLAFTGGSMPRAAAILGIDRRSLYRIVERYRIDRPTRRLIQHDAQSARPREMAEATAW